MKKKYFDIIKTELKTRRENTKYFNYKFFVKYLEAIQTGAKNEKAGIDDRYKDGIITKFHRYDEIYTDNFYIKNGGCYCEFLAIVSEYYNRLLTA